jgi:mono/diheme cytochrome c family protein
MSRLKRRSSLPAGAAFWGRSSSSSGWRSLRKKEESRPERRTSPSPRARRSAPTATPSRPRHRRALEGQHPRQEGRGPASSATRPRRNDADAFSTTGTIATVVTPAGLRPLPRRGRAGVRPEPPRRRRQHPRLPRQLPGRDGGGRARQPFAPALADARRDGGPVNGMASAKSGCQQCHGSKVALKTKDGWPDRRRPEAGARRQAHQPSGGRQDRQGPRTASRARGQHLAQHRHRPPQPGRLQGLLLGLPQPPRLLTRSARASRRTAASATSARIIRRRRSTRSRSTASPSAIKRSR